MRYRHDFPEGFKKERGKTYIAVAIERGFMNYGYLKKKWEKFLGLTGIDTTKVVLITSGIERLVDKLSKEYNIREIYEIVPDWDEYGIEAGKKRNENVLRVADMVFALTKQKEISNHCIYLIKEAEKKRIPVFEFKIKGEER